MYSWPCVVVYRIHQHTRCTRDTASFFSPRFLLDLHANSVGGASQADDQMPESEVLVVGLREAKRTSDRARLHAEVAQRVRQAQLCGNRVLCDLERLAEVLRAVVNPRQADRVVLPIDNLYRRPFRSVASVDLQTATSARPFQIRMSCGMLARPLVAGPASMRMCSWKADCQQLIVESP